jgi:uncharacterized glyoxalase superfamily protein PhnB
MSREADVAATEAGAAVSGGSAAPAAERSITSEVSVGVSPQAAFTAFTAEMDLWWVRGPINFFDAGRAAAMVCEPGVGGRILEVYDSAAGDALELARITAWEPGELIAWRSSVDDVAVEVSFAAFGAGALVRVVATVPPGGKDEGGSFWTRVVPAWFGNWCERRDTASREPVELDRLALAVYYAKPIAAAHWLASAFGLAPVGALPPADSDQDADPQHTWIEFRVGRCSVMLFASDGDRPESGGGTHAPTHVPWVHVDDLDAHLAQAQRAGAAIVQPIRQHGYRVYQAEDLEGHRWTFAQARPTMRRDDR